MKGKTYLAVPLFGASIRSRALYAFSLYLLFVVESGAFDSESNSPGSRPKPAGVNPATGFADAHSHLWVRLKNGDRFSGQLVTNSFPLITGQGTTRSVSVQELDGIDFRTNDGQITVFLRDGRTLEGRLTLRELAFRLDWGPTLDLKTDAIERIGTGAETKARLQLTGPSAMGEGHGASTNLAGMVWLPAGEFQMGSPTEETGRDPDESPQTRVIIARGLWIGKCEVTQSEYQRVMGLNPSNGTGDAMRPVERVNWFEAMEYCKKLNQVCESEGKLPEGFAYRLPTEAEWEYACRAGAATRFCYGEDRDAMQLSDYAWFSRNSDSMTHPVGTRQPNRWGLFDMHGNVWEWCLDRWEDSLPGGTVTNLGSATTGNLRVARGGSWLYDAKACRAANRDDYSPWDRCSDIGFRVVLAPIQP